MLMKYAVMTIRPILKLLDFITPLIDLSARWWIAYIFFKAGVLKIMSWQSTIMLFTHEFSVPFLSPYFAALIGTGAELVLPILLFLGLGGRLSILIFFIYNAIATLSYPHLWTPEGGQGLAQHINWGLLLALLMAHGSGKLSIDYWLKKKYGACFMDYMKNGSCSRKSN